MTIKTMFQLVHHIIKSYVQNNNNDGLHINIYIYVITLHIYLCSHDYSSIKDIAQNFHMQNNF